MVYHSAWCHHIIVTVVPGDSMTNFHPGPFHPVGFWMRPETAPFSVLWEASSTFGWRGTRRNYVSAFFPWMPAPICRTHFSVGLRIGVDVPDVWAALRPCLFAPNFRLDSESISARAPVGVSKLNKKYGKYNSFLLEVWRVRLNLKARKLCIDGAA